MNSVKWTIKVRAFTAHKWEREEPRASRIDSFQSQQDTACTYALQCRAFVSLFVHFFALEMLLYISNMLISLRKEYFFIF